VVDWIARGGDGVGALRDGRVLAACSWTR